MALLPLDRLSSGAASLGVVLDSAQLELLDRFATLLVEANRTTNLTRITEPDDIVDYHYLDSFTCLRTLEPAVGARGVDVGSGAGFPGIPLAIARPDLSVTLMDSSGKKLAFAGAVAEELGLSNVRIVRARAEEAGRDPSEREVYDIAWARALAEMRVVVELCLPLVRPGGSVVAQKSDRVDEELAPARPLIGQLGGRVIRVEQMRLPGTEALRRLVVVQKIRHTPQEFPRPYARMRRGKGVS